MRQRPVSPSSCLRSSALAALRKQIQDEGNWTEDVGARDSVIKKGALWDSAPTSVLTVQRGTRRQKGLEIYLPPLCAQNQLCVRHIGEESEG